MLTMNADYAAELETYGNLILTPNIKEFERLCKRYSVVVNEQALVNLARKFKGNTVIVQKGKIDKIADAQGQCTSPWLASTQGLKRLC